MPTKSRRNRTLLRWLGILVIPIVLMAYTLLLIAVVLSEEASSARVLVMLVLFGQVGIGLLVLMSYLMFSDMRAHEITQQIAPDVVHVPEISPDEKVPPGREMPRRVKHPVVLALVAVFVFAWVGQITAALLLLAIRWYASKQPKSGLSCGMRVVYLMTIVLSVVLAIAAWVDHYALNVVFSTGILLTIPIGMYQKRRR